MNTANLQLEGLLLVLAELLRELERKSVITGDELAAVLNAAQDRTQHEINGRAGLSDANALAIQFPIAFLRRAVTAGGEERSFSDLARDVADEGVPQRW